MQHRGAHVRISLFLIAVSIGLAQVPSSLPVASVRPNDSRRIRTAIGKLLGWDVGIPATAFPQSGFLEAAGKADALGLPFIEGFSTQKVSADLQKPLDSNLSTEEREVILNRLAQLKIRMLAYHTGTIPSSETAQRKLLEFVKSLKGEILIGTAEKSSFATLDKLASEIGISIALEISDPKTAASTVSNLGPRIGVVADLDSWSKQSVSPIKDRIHAVTVRDCSSPALTAFLLEMSRQLPDPKESPMACGDCSRPIPAMKPVFFAIQAKSAERPFEELAASLEQFEKAVQPAMGHRIDNISRILPIANPSQIPADARKRIEDALPKKAAVKPKKPRKLLVIDLSPAGGYYHAQVPYTNYAIELMGKNTGAYEAVFNNDLSNLRYEKIKQFDAVFFNSTVGELFPDPEVRNGLLRFVREGGGVAGLHGASYASMDLPEIAEMFGAADGPHRIELGTMRIEDPRSPLNVGFQGKETYSYTDEYYRFMTTGPYSREKLHVLLTLDLDEMDVSRAKPPYLRPDNDYGISWIKSYGKGRVFNCALGHTLTLFMRTPLAEHVLAGIQFILGDLPADTTPSAQLHSKAKK